MKRPLLLTSARWSLRLLALLWLAVGLVVLLSGCGGSTCDDPEAEEVPVRIPAQPCKERPEACL